MKEEYFKEYSHFLNREMEFKIYGHTGKPVLVFPPGSGRFWHYELHGMVNACKPYIDAGKIQLFCVDGIDWDSWDNREGNPYDRIRRQEEYFKYVTEEFIPRMKEMSRNMNEGKEIGILATGCSMGATHSAITFFRRPDLIDSVIALSGLYSPRYFMGDYVDDIVYLNSPLYFLPDIHDERVLDKMRNARLAFCVGQGAWEDPMIEETIALKHILEEKHIPAFVDIWGKDVNHDWDWWQIQMPYFLDRVLD